MNVMHTYRSKFHALSALPLTISMLVLFVSLAGCSKGIDRTIVTTSDEAAYRASLDKAAKEATKEQLAAYDWAVSDQTLPKLREQYPNRSAREIIRGEVAKVLRDLPPRIESVEAMQREWDKSAAKVAAVSADEVSFALDKDFFGLQPTITAKVHNGTPFSFASYGWIALLYLDDSATPVAKARVSVNFTREDGSGQAFDPGKTEEVTMVVGFVSGDANWKTAEIQRAHKRTLKLVPQPDRARDLGGKPFVDESPDSQVDLDELKTTVQQAKAYQNI